MPSPQVKHQTPNAPTPTKHPPHRHPPPNTIQGTCHHPRSKAQNKHPNMRRGITAPPSVVNNEGEATRRQLVHEDLVADTGNNRQEELGLTIDLDDRIHRHPTLAWNAPENHFPALHMRTRMKRPCGVQDNRANDIEVAKVVIRSDQ